MKRHYTAREVSVMRTMRSEGHSFSAIARALDRPVGSVRERARRSEIPHRTSRKLTDAQIAWAVTAFSEGMTRKAIGEHFGVSADTIGKIPEIASSPKVKRQVGAVIGIELRVDQHELLHRVCAERGMTKAYVIRRALDRELALMLEQG